MNYKDSLLKNITFLNNYRTYKKGFKISFEKQVNVVTGDNGSGKSSLISCIRNFFDAKWTYSHDSRADSIIEIDSDPTIKIGYLCFSSDSHKTASEIDFDDFDTWKNCMDSSSGQSSIIQLKSFLSIHENFKLIILDEPERGLSSKNVRIVLSLLKEHIKEHPLQQIIISTNSEILMSISEDEKVFSASHMKTITVNDYISFMEA